MLVLLPRSPPPRHPSGWPDVSSSPRRPVIIVGAVGVVAARNPVHAALILVMTLFGVAVLFVEQQADFLAAVQIIVYAGAIVVLFLFVIMFLGVDRAEDIRIEPLPVQRPARLRALLPSPLAGVLVPWRPRRTGSPAPTRWWARSPGASTDPARRRGEPAQLGKQLFTTYLFAFEATAALLVIAVVGAVVLARRAPAAAEHAGSRRRSRGRPSPRASWRT